MQRVQQVGLVGVEGAGHGRRLADRGRTSMRDSPGRARGFYAGAPGPAPGPGAARRPGSTARRMLPAARRRPGIGHQRRRRPIASEPRTDADRARWPSSCTSSPSCRRSPSAPGCCSSAPRARAPSPARQGLLGADGGDGAGRAFIRSFSGWSLDVGPLRLGLLHLFVPFTAHGVYGALATIRAGEHRRPPGGDARALLRRPDHRRPARLHARPGDVPDVLRLSARAGLAAPPAGSARSGSRRGRARGPRASRRGHSAIRAAAANSTAPVAPGRMCAPAVVEEPRVRAWAGTRTADLRDRPLCGSRRRRAGRA